MKSPDIKIRKATNQDTDTCISLSKNSRPTRRPDNNTLGSKHIQEAIQNNRGLVVEHENNTIGFAIRGQLRNKIHIQDIFIQESYRRHGIGQEILSDIIKIGKEQGYKEIISDCDIDNQSSINFHIKNGFTQTGRIEGHRDGIDSYTFVKKL